VGRDADSRFVVNNTTIGVTAWQTPVGGGNAAAHSTIQVDSTQ